MLVLQYTPDMSVKVGLHMKRFSSQGFALPTVLIASVVMMIILATSVAGTVATRTAIKAQQYDQQASVAAESGLAMAAACIKSGVTTWANPLRPGSTCSGRGANSPCTDPSCYVMQADNMRTTFEVSAPTYSGDSTIIESKGSTQLVRTTNQGVWRSYSQVLRKQSINTGNYSMQWKQISSYNQNVCAVSFTDKLYCWGSNAAGQVGDGTTAPRAQPTAVLAGAIPAGVTIESVSVGSVFVCALASNDQAYCWGSNSNGQLGDNSTVSKLVPTAVAQGDRPAGVTFQEVKTGGTHACGIGSNGVGYCWGLSSNGQLGVNSTAQRLVPTYISQGAIPAGSTLKQIALGDAHTCAVASNDLMYCWGSNSGGQVGNNSNTQRVIPTAVSQGSVPTGVVASTIYAKGSHTCAIATNNLAYCWGSNASGQVGNNSAAVARITPAAVSLGAMPAGTTIKSLGLGSQHTCALASNNVTYCWGLNSSSRLGDGTTTNRIVPVASTQAQIPNGTTTRQIDGGDAYTCVLGSDDQTYCLGNNGSGTFGNGTTNSSTTLVAASSVPLGATEPIIDSGITAATYHTCAVGSENSLYCWGYNINGQLGDGTTTQRTSPVAVVRGAIPATAKIRQVSSRAHHTCALASDSKAYCWGNNTDGRLGDGSTTQRTSPVAVSQGAIPAGLTIRQISAGVSHSCAIASDNKAYCWGNNDSGQLGDGTTTQRSEPVAVLQGAIPAGLTIRQITAGSFVTCAIASDNKAYCWGNNERGQIGDNTTTQRSTAVAVLQGATPTGATIRQIAQGNLMTCAIASDDKPYCWGANGNGQLGDGTTTDRLVPTAVALNALPSGTLVRQVSTGIGSSCIVSTTNQAYCWGSNSSGAVGDGTTANRSTPTAIAQGAVPSGVTMRQISTGNEYSCAIASNSQVYCWGLNMSGMLGDGTTTNRTSPVAILSLPAYPQPFSTVRYY